MDRPVTIDCDRTVTIRRPAAQLDAIDAVGTETDVPRSEAMRQPVDYALRRKLSKKIQSSSEV
jgi:hypothetical protein